MVVRLQSCPGIPSVISSLYGVTVGKRLLRVATKPPRRGCFSTSTTSKPASADCRAAVIPVMPPPTTRSFREMMSDRIPCGFVFCAFDDAHAQAVLGEHLRIVVLGLVAPSNLFPDVHALDERRRCPSQKHPSSSSASTRQSPGCSLCPQPGPAGSYLNAFAPAKEGMDAAHKESLGRMSRHSRPAFACPPTPQSHIHCKYETPSLLSMRRASGYTLESFQGCSGGVLHGWPASSGRHTQPAP